MEFTVKWRKRWQRYVSELGVSIHTYMLLLHPLTAGPGKALGHLKTKSQEGVQKGGPSLKHSGGNVACVHA